MRVTPFLMAIGAALLASGCQTIRPGTPATYANCDQMIARYARTRPGLLSVQEWGQHAWDTGGVALDRNHDGRIDLPEWTSRTEPPTDRYERDGYEHQQRSFERLDRGHKGYLDLADLTRDAAPGFHRLDRNHDGWLTRDECAARLPPPLELV